MVYKIKFISDEVDGFVREIKIDSDATFLDLNKIILESCGYPDDQMTSFYICNDEWERKEQVTREDMGTSDADEDIFVMEDTILSEFIEDEDQKMEFVFDPFAERVFYLDVTEVVPGESLKVPQIVRAKGDAPQQIEELDYSIPSVPKVGASSFEEDDVDEFYGNDGFNDDDFDPEGFEFSDGETYN